RASVDWSPARSASCQHPSYEPFSDLDLGDANRRGRLPVAAMATVVLPALELHDLDLPSTPLADDLAGDPGAREGLRVCDHLAVARHQQHRLELDRRARLAGQLLDRDDLPRRHAVLLAARRDDRFHESRPFRTAPSA